MVTFQAIAIKKHTPTSSISFCNIQLIPSVIGASTNVIILECRLAHSYGCSHSRIILDNSYLLRNQLASTCQLTTYQHVRFQSHRALSVARIAFVIPDIDSFIALLYLDKLNLLANLFL